MRRFKQKIEINCVRIGVRDCMYITTMGNYVPVEADAFQKWIEWNEIETSCEINDMIF